MTIFLWGAPVNNGRCWWKSIWHEPTCLSPRPTSWLTFLNFNWPNFSPQIFPEWDGCRWCPGPWFPRFRSLLARSDHLPYQSPLSPVYRSQQSVRGKNSEAKCVIRVITVHMWGVFNAQWGAASPLCPVSAPWQRFSPSSLLYRTCFLCLLAPGWWFYRKAPN